MRSLDPAGETPPGLHHLPTSIVDGRAIVVTGPNQRKLVRDGRVFRQKFTNFDRIGLRAHRFERSANFARRIRLHVPQIDVTGPTEIEDHDARRVFLARFDEARFFGSEHLRKREADSGQRADLQEFATIQARPAKPRTILWGFGEEIEHDWIVSESSDASNRQARLFAADGKLDRCQQTAFRSVFEREGLVVGVKLLQTLASV